MNNDKDNITAGLPNPSGALYWAPSGTKLPTSADEALDAAFVNLGYVSEDGLTSSTAESGEDKRAWGGDIVYHSQTEYGETFTFALLESVRPSVAQLVYGVDNVTLGNNGEVIKVNRTGNQLPRGVLICDTLQNNGGDNTRIHRQIAGDAQLTDRSGDRTYNDADLLSIPTTVTAYKYKQDGLTATGGDYVTDLYSPVTTTP